MVVTRHSEFAGIQVERLFKFVHDAALPRPGVVSIVILHPEGGGIFLPVGRPVYATAVVLSEDERHKVIVLDTNVTARLCGESLQKHTVSYSTQIFPDCSSMLF